MIRRPSFQFYPADWLSDFKVQAMTAEQRGAYIQLLCCMWLEDSCSLPNDMEQLAAITKCPIEPLRTVVQCFVENGSLITHKRLLAERERQDDWREKSKRAGIASGKSRKRKPKITIEPTFNQTRTKCEPNTNTSSSSSSSSSSNSSNEELESTPAQKACDFFKNPDFQAKVIDYFIAKGLAGDIAQNELPKFIRYWTEPNKSGTKVRWQIEPTFDIHRRLFTWFERANHYSPTNKKGGVTIIS